tara:strand:- start:138 stop:329 length:192 start_codon:yes stop_codon:yes gene_type:complete
MKQSVEVQITLNYKDQPSEAIDGKTHPTRERIMRDLYEMIREGKSLSYKEIRRTQHKPIESER